MTDTIKLLETIGKDASLRHMSNQDLSGALDTLDASETLKAASASGDSGILRQELNGGWLNSSNHPTNANITVPEVPEIPEEEEEEEDDDEVEPEKK